MKSILLSEKALLKNISYLGLKLLILLKTNTN